MSDYISRTEALRAIDLDDEYAHYKTRENMLNVPSADVRENIHGEWKRISPAGIYECSCCGQNVMTSDIECYKFCHGCGARMRGE